jgi:hypothetical protein
MLLPEAGHRRGAKGLLHVRQLGCKAGRLLRTWPGLLQLRHRQEELLRRDAGMLQGQASVLRAGHGLLRVQQGRNVPAGAGGVRRNPPAKGCVLRHQGFPQPALLPSGL